MFLVFLVCLLFKSVGGNKGVIYRLATNSHNFYNLGGDFTYQKFKKKIFAIKYSLSKYR